MRNEDLIALLTAYTNKTTRLRTSIQHWSIATETELDNIACNLGRLISLIQDCINRNLFSIKEDEYLLIYNGERIVTSSTSSYWNLNMIVKPITQIEDTASLVGKSFQLIINSNTGEVMNPTKCLLDVGLITSQETSWSGPDIPVSYGNFNQYLAPCCFMAISSYRPLQPLEDFFKGKYDHNTAIGESKAYDSYLEATNFLSQQKEIGKYIAELPHPKEKIVHLKQAGLGKEIGLITDVTNHSLIAPYPRLKKDLFPLQEELDRLKAALNISQVFLVTSEEQMKKKIEISIENNMLK